VNRTLISGPTATVVFALLFGLSIGCGGGGGTNGGVVIADAQYDPVGAFDSSPAIHETAVAVAQTFTVLATGKFERFQFVITQGTPGSEGMIRIDVRPLLVTGEPETTDVNSIITPIDVDTTTLPATLLDEFTIFDVGDQPNREVAAGERYAIVVRFLSRSVGVANTPIAIVLGRTGDEYLDGAGSIDLNGAGFTNNAIDYFFRTFVLQ